MKPREPLPLRALGSTVSVVGVEGAYGEMFMCPETCLDNEGKANRA